MPGEEEDSCPVLSDRSNIVVITDEAHRSQYRVKEKFKGDGKGNQVVTPNICITHYALSSCVICSLPT